jgi:hypothetical protein
VNKPKARKYNSVVAPYASYQIDVDTGFLKMGAKKEAFLLAVDVFSRQVAARAIANLRGQTVKIALSSMLKELGGVEKLRSDFGTELNNKWVNELLKNREVEHIHAYPPLKANYSERGIRTFKRKLYLMTRKTGNKNWSKYLQAIVKAQNNTKMKVLGGATPMEVAKSKEKQDELWMEFKKRRFINSSMPRSYKYKVGDIVRYKLTNGTGIDKKEFDQSMSTQTFSVTQRSSPDNVNRYKVKDFKNQQLEGSFTESQLQLVLLDDQTEYKIEKIVSRRVREGVRQARVRWMGYPPSEDTWLNVADIKKLK